MIKMLDFAVYIFYTAYVGRSFKSKWKQAAYKSLLEYMVSRAEQTRSATAWSLSISGSMLLNYVF